MIAAFVGSPVKGTTLLIIDSEHVHILRPSGFEFAGKLQDAVLQAVLKNIEAIKAELPFVDFAGICEYAVKHPRAARYIASIRGNKGTKDVDICALQELCKATVVQVQVAEGRVIVDAANCIDFLELLDRRRYGLELVPGSPERFRAGGRRKIES